jgi:DNA primase
MNIKELLKIEEVIAYYGIKLNRHNKAVCPFHNEKTPSFSVNTNKQYFKCFGCNESGDAIDFVKKLYSIDFKQAVLRLNHDFNLGISDGKPDKRYLIKLEQKRMLAKIQKEEQKNNNINFRKTYFKFHELKPKEKFEELTDEFIAIMLELNKLELGG